MAIKATRVLHAQSGFSLIDLLVTTSIFGIVALAGLPHLDRRREDINTSVQQVVADLRYARSRSITSGEHYSIEWSSAHAYEVQRLALNGAGVWEVDRVERTITLPEYISISFGEEPMDRLEFNTRGMMISSSQPLWPVISDLDRDVEHTLAIWPSGQIYRED